MALTQNEINELHTETLEATETVRLCDSLETLEKQFVLVFERLGFEWMHLCNVYDPEKGVDFYGYIGKTPKGLMDEYIQNELYINDPNHRIGREPTNQTPIYWKGIGFKQLPIHEKNVMKLVDKNDYIISGLSMPLDVNRTIRFGAGVVHKGGGRELVTVMESFQFDLWMFSLACAQRIVKSFLTEFFANSKLPLSRKTLSILAAIRQGNSDIEIEQKMGITIRQTEYALSVAKNKLGTRNRTQTVCKAFDLGLIS